tara:strand:+ start:633 stop:2837 length:2205 start_codon:yes stop_codon:yes gene_type:complete
MTDIGDSGAGGASLRASRTAYQQGIAGAAKNKQDSYKQYVLGLVGGYYPTPWSGDVMKTSASQVSNWYSTSKGSISTSGWKPSLVEVKGINFHSSKSHGDKVRFDGDAMWPLGGNPTWYVGHRGYEAVKDDFLTTITDHKSEAEDRAMSRGLRAGRSMDEILRTTDQPTDELWKHTTEGLAAEDNIDIDEDLAVELLIQEVLSDYRKNSARYTKNYLSHLNLAAKRMIKGIHDVSDMPKGETTGVTTDQPGKTYTFTEGADVREEEVGVLSQHMGPNAKAFSPKEITELRGDPLGATKKTDTVFRVGGRFWFQEVTEQTIDSDTGHHGISSGGILGKDKIKELLDEGEKGKLKLRREIYDYFREQHTLYNEAIRGIKDIAGRKTIGKYGTGIEQSPQGAGMTAAEKLRAPVSIEAMMKGKGGVSRPMLTVTDPKAGGWGWQKRRAWLHARKAAGKSLSLANRTMLSQIGDQYKRDIQLSSGRTGRVDKHIVEFVNHAVGNFPIHGGQFYGGLTVSKDPHMTASILFEMFKEGHERELEFNEGVFNLKRVQLWEGYLTIARLVQAGAMSEEEAQKAIFAQGAVHEVSKMTNGVTKLTINQISNLSKASIGKNLKTGFRVIVPDQIGQVAMAKIHAKLGTTAGRRLVLKNLNFRKGTHDFGGMLRETQNKAREDQKQGMNQTYTYGNKTGVGSFIRRYGSGKYDEDAPYPKDSWISAAPYIGLHIVKPGIASKKRD